MTKANTLESWRPHPLAYIYCSLAIVLLELACYWGMALLLSKWQQPENALKGALLVAMLFGAALWLSLRRCSTPGLSASRGLLLITACMTIGVGNLSLLFVIPAVAFAILSVMAIAFLSLFGKDAAYAPKQFHRLIEFYRRNRMYQ